MSKIQHSAASGTVQPSRYRLRKTVALVGMMGAGKTAVGRAVAAKLGVPFLDSDAEIEAAANQSVQEIFDRDGEVFFRQRESEIIARLLDTQRGILSTGGGVYLSELNRTNITRGGVALWLNAGVDLLWQRVRHKDTRPLLRTKNPRATLEEIYATRTPIYALSELSVRCDTKLSIDAMAERVIAALAERPDVLEYLDA